MRQDESAARTPPPGAPAQGAGAQTNGLDADGPPGAPRWVKVSAVVAVVVLLVLASVLVFGGGDHGPGRHAPVDGATEPGQTRQASGQGGSEGSGAVAVETNARHVTTRAAPAGL